MGTFVIRGVVTAFLFYFACCSAHAGSFYPDEDNEAGTRGYYWYEKLKEKEEPDKQPPAAAPEKKPTEPKKYEWESRKELKYDDFTPQQIWDMPPKEMGDLLDAFKDQSVRTLKESHVHDFYRMLRTSINKAAGWTNVQQMVVNKYPDVSMEHDASINPPGQDAIKEMKLAEVSQKIATSRNEYGLVYFYRPNCPYCAAEEKVLRLFQESRHVEIKGVNIAERPDLAAQFNITITPTLLLVQKGNEGYQPISYGVISLEELDYRVFSTIRLMEGQIAPEQYGMREYERGGAYDPLAPLNKNQSASPRR